MALVLGLIAAPSALASLFGRHRHHGQDPARMKKHAEFATEFVLREEELALWDAASTRLVDALVDAAAALTPEQRAELITLARERHGHRGD